MAERLHKVKERKADPTSHKAGNSKFDTYLRSCDPLAECRDGGHVKYEKLKDLSTGAFGFVQLCRNKRSGQLVAIKFLERVCHALDHWHMLHDGICLAKFAELHLVLTIT